MDHPLVSVIVPVYNAVDTIDVLLDSLQRLDYPNYETLVVDNGSSDGTAARIRAWPFVRYVSETDRQSSYAARNAGFRASQGSILAFTDGDCTVHPSWLSTLVPAFLDPGVGAAAGLVVARHPVTVVERLSERHGLLDQRNYFARHRLPTAVTANLAVRRDVLDRLGGFDADLTTGGDFDLCFRLQLQLSRRLALVPEAIVEHRHRSTWRGLLVQSCRNGEAAAILKRRYPQLSRPVPAAQRATDLWHALGGPFRYLQSGTIDELFDPVFVAVRYAGLLLGYVRESRR